MMQSAHFTDCLLVQLTAQSGKTSTVARASVASRFACFCAQSTLPLSLHRVAWSASTQTAYCYARLVSPGQLAAEALVSMTDWWAREGEGFENIRVSRLEQVFVATGRSAEATPAFHYVVEMDPEEGWMPEISRWYDGEHMPGLAAVEGCILALRLLNHDHGPYSLACYDLVSDQALNLPAWLAVRGTAWSDITRPHFTNTIRTMFETKALKSHDNQVIVSKP
jgi:hypothetical protein